MSMENWYDRFANSDYHIKYQFNSGYQFIFNKVELLWNGIQSFAPIYIIKVAAAKKKFVTWAYNSCPRDYI